jgi:hypothetical protein
VVGYRVFKWRKIIFDLKMRHAINSAVNFYNAGVVTHDRRIGSRVIIFYPGANPTTAIYSASAVKIYNAKSSLVRFENKQYFILL